MTMKTLLFIFMMVLFTSCSPKAVQMSSTPESELGFSLNLFRKALESSKADANVSVSPYSAGVALAMLNCGADGQTRAELDNALGGCDFKDVDLRANDTVTVTSANSLWIDNDFSIRNSYVDMLSKDYGALADALSFSDPATVQAINDWCSENTAGMIKGIITRIEPATVLILANALYFKAPWKEPFDPSATRNAVFHGSKGDSETLFMNRKLSCGYVEYEGNQMVRIPYEGGRYAMYVLLPSEDLGVEGVLPYITDTGLKEILPRMSSRQVKVSLPKFKVETEMSLVKTLQEMGVRSAFTPEADLSGIAHGPLCVSDIFQKSVVDVDEKGSEAAAVTAIMVRMTSARIESDPVMTIDRPFYYMIADMDSERILFAGRIMNL